MIEEIKDITNETEEESRTVVFEEALEAILFAAGHPVTYATLARVMEMTPAKVKDRVFEYALKYNNSPIPRGVTLLTFADSCQLCTNHNYLPEIRDALGIKKSGTLSTSAIEVLAIIAYNQPVTRAFVDTLRRVDSSYAMNSLLDRGLIHSTGRLDVPGRPMLYGTTSDFLRCFGLPSLEALPSTSDEMIQAFSNAKGDEEEKESKNHRDGVLPDQIEVDIDEYLPKDIPEESVEKKSDSQEDDSKLDNDAPEVTPEYEFDELSAEDEVGLD